MPTKTKLTNMDRIRAAVKTLAKLGSAGAIASHFRKLGIRSKVGCVKHCAVADYIFLRGARKFEVDGENVEDIHMSDDWGNRQPGDYTIPLPTCVQEFIESFDAGRYPALVKKN